MRKSKLKVDVKLNVSIESNAKRKSPLI
ncbi:hypothetical protein MGSAQ_003169, partial [marine sediment metagenome]